jgi:hypothetical protein
MGDDAVLTPQAAAELLGVPQVGSYLQDAFRTIGPPRLTRGTVRALTQYLEHRRRIRHEPFVHDLTDSRPGTVLRDRWVAEGGSEDELVKFITVGEYRIRTLHSASFFEKRELSASAELEAFWVAGGHDMTELVWFMSEVDNEVGDWLPK